MKETTTFNPFQELLNHQFEDTTKGAFWINRYIKFIKAVQKKRVYCGEPSERWNCHKHHIVPRSWGGSDCSDNIITMTIKEHIVAHHLLCKTMDPSMGFALVKLMGFANDRDINPNLLFNYAISLRLAEDANKSRCLQLMQPVINLMTGQRYEGVYQASLEVYGNDWTIATAMMTGKKTNDGCYWLKECDVIHDLQWHIDNLDKRNHLKRESRRLKLARSVVNLNTGETYISATDAAKAIGYNPDSMTDAIRNRTLLAKCWWEYEDNIVTDVESELAWREEIKNIINKYAKYSQLIDLCTNVVYDTTSDAAIDLNTSIATVSRYLRGFRPFVIEGKEHYLVKLRYAEDKGREELLKHLRLKNVKYCSSLDQYTKPKAVINLSTRERFDSIADARKKYPDDDIRHYVLTKNPSVTLEHYWMYEDEIIKSYEEHLIENTERFERFGRSKRRNSSNYQSMQLINVRTGERYSSASECAIKLNIKAAGLRKKINTEMYYFESIDTAIVPESVYSKIDSVDEFVSQQREKYRVSKYNNNIVDVVDKKIYSSILEASRYSDISSGAIKHGLFKKVQDCERRWIRENSIPYNEYKTLELQFVA